MKYLKLVGNALLAMLVLAAVAAPVSLADDFTAEKYPVLLTGKVDPGTSDQFSSTIGTVSCNSPTYAATASAATTVISITPNYSDTGCFAAGVPATIQPNGCTYKITVEGATSTTGDFDLVCPAGNEFTATPSPASGTHPCTLHIKPQSDIAGAVKFVNVGIAATREVTVELALTGIDYTHTAGTGLAKCTAGSATNGTLNSKSIFTGENHVGTEHVGLFMSNV